MNPDHIISRLAHNAEAIRGLTRGISSEQARWRPDPDSWSILEVINHLYDEEKEDFRAHLDAILHHPEQPWLSIDPQGWVTQRGYNRRDPEETLNNFLSERKKSLKWLESLSSPDWEASIRAPFGKLTAGDVFASWVAHDLLHLRQLVELHWAYNLGASRPHRVDYAGGW
jgi:hypothetical protein